MGKNRRAKRILKFKCWREKKKVGFDLTSSHAPIMVLRSMRPIHDPSWSARSSWTASSKFMGWKKINTHVKKIGKVSTLMNIYFFLRKEKRSAEKREIEYKIYVESCNLTYKSFKL